MKIITLIAIFLAILLILFILGLLFPEDREEEGKEDSEE